MYRTTQHRPSGATLSRDVSGHNQDCVIAAFRTVKPGINDLDLASQMTNTEEGIAKVAQVYGMSKIEPDKLPTVLQKGRRAFINAPSLGDPSRYHAAIGLDASGKIIAWDPDNDHADLKLVPVKLVWLAYA